jgi:hypothetical protein
VPAQFFVKVKVKSNCGNGCVQCSSFCSSFVSTRYQGGSVYVRQNFKSNKLVVVIYVGKEKTESEFVKAFILCGGGFWLTVTVGCCSRWDLFRGGEVQRGLGVVFILVVGKQ